MPWSSDPEPSGTGTLVTVLRNLQHRPGATRISCVLLRRLPERKHPNYGQILAIGYPGDVQCDADLTPGIHGQIGQHRESYLTVALRSQPSAHPNHSWLQP